MIRLLLGLPFAGVITVALFLLMRFLVLPEFKEPEQVADNATIDITRPERDENTNLDRNKPDRPKQQAAPPPPPPMQVDARVNPANTNLNVSMPNFGVDLGDLNAPSDRSAIPLVTVPPIYPDRAATRGTEGWVILEFDISPEGSVHNPVVIDALPSSIFNRAALKAIRKWKFKAKVVDGKPVWQYGKEWQITFQLDK